MLSSAGGEACGAPCAVEEEGSGGDDGDGRGGGGGGVELECLSDPFLVFEFDFSASERIPPPVGRTTEINVTHETLKEAAGMLKRTLSTTAGVVIGGIS